MNRMLLCILLTMLSVWMPVYGQVDEVHSGLPTLDSVCANVPSDRNERELTETLKRIDAIPSTGQLTIQLEHAIRGANTDYCDAERIFRAIGAKTFLVALPLAHYDNTASVLTLTYAGRSPGAGPLVPRFAVWFERGGKDAALQLLNKYKISEEQNLRNLSSAGHLARSANIHKYFSISASNPLPQDEYQSLRKTLGQYAEAGNLGNSDNVSLMYAMDAYLAANSGPKFAINRFVAPDVLSLYVIDKDPERILSRGLLTCNCGNLPKSNIVICDQTLLKALSGWNNYEMGAAIVRSVNEMNDEFILNWIVGHEIGHFIKGHSFGGRFDSLADTGTKRSLAPNDRRRFEEEADDFAAANMPPYLIGGLMMSANLLFHQLYIAIGLPADSDAKTSPIVYEDPNGHPTLLTRLYSFREAVGRASGIKLHDSMWDGRQELIQWSADMGFSFPSICEMSSALKSLSIENDERGHK